MTEITRCRHDILDGNIHQLTFLESSREAIDAMLEVLVRLARESPLETTLRLAMYNTGNRQQPLVYTMARLREIIKEIPVRPPTRIAFVEEGFIAAILDGTFRAMLTRRDRLRVFKPADRDKMLEWLRRDD